MTLRICGASRKSSPGDTRLAERPLQAGGVFGLKDRF
jgi:hypothetical protein